VDHTHRARIINEAFEFLIENSNIIAVGIFLLTCFVYKKEIQNVIIEIRPIETMKPLKNDNKLINLEFNDLDNLRENSYIWKSTVNYIDYSHSWCHLFYTSLSGSGHTILPMASFFIITSIFFSHR